ncbi:hypothetical protein G7054_g10633 [Neopestalotiopsis clavispora]|nr:hypothetical protein G7054_g10633 [Neopestalotiopsis clavispora]
MSQLPETKEEILATGVIDPKFKKVIEQTPVPRGSFYELSDLKDINELSLPWTQKRLAANRPPNIAEHERCITMKEGSPGAPLGHCARRRRGAADLPPRTQGPIPGVDPGRLGHGPPPRGRDAKAAAAGSDASEPPLLPRQCDPSRGFIVGGTSAGANLAASIAHLARNEQLDPPLTGQMLVAGTYISHRHVPKRYRPWYLAREQNRDAPVFDLDLSEMLQNAFRPDHASPLWAIFDQHDPRDENYEDADDPGVKYGHMGLPPAYFQICGLDPGRDDSLIYERVLQEECRIQTKADIYPGYPHVWWSNYPELEASKKRDDDAVVGIAWLLGFSS